jgi:hypothetical protein
MKAGERVDVGGTIREARRIPCICPRQDDETVAHRTLTLSSSDSRGYVIERVACLNCPRTWSRINCQ